MILTIILFRLLLAVIHCIVCEECEISNNRVKTGYKWAGLEDIYGALTDLWEAAELETGSGERLGYLTSQDRRAWAEAYTELEAASQTNKVNNHAYDLRLSLQFCTLIALYFCLAEFNLQYCTPVLVLIQHKQQKS